MFKMTWLNGIKSSRREKRATRTDQRYALLPSKIPVLNSSKERSTWIASVGFGRSDPGLFNPFILLWDESNASLELSSIRHEIKGLILLESQMSRSLEALKARKQSTEFDGTVAGKAWSWFGRLFSIYCIGRICSVRAYRRQRSTLTNHHSSP